MPRPIFPTTPEFPNKSSNQASFDLPQGHGVANFDGTLYTAGKTFPSSEDIYRQLDGAQATHGGRAWRLVVSAIHSERNEHWLQISVNAGVMQHELVVHMPAHTRPHNVISSIEAWLACPASDNRIIHVS